MLRGLLRLVLLLLITGTPSSLSPSFSHDENSKGKEEEDDDEPMQRVKPRAPPASREFASLVFCFGAEKKKKKQRGRKNATGQRVMAPPSVLSAVRLRPANRCLAVLDCFVGQVGHSS